MAFVIVMAAPFGGRPVVVVYIDKKFSQQPMPDH